LEKSGLVAGEDFYFAYCPERVLPGKILFELEHNNRIIGGINARSAEVARDLYSIFVKGDIFLTDTTTAEVCKLVENTYRDVNIALANELAQICEKLGCSVWDVIKFANKHPRVNLHQPGPGVGGHCIAVDPWFIVQSMDGIANIIELARKTNDNMPKFVSEKIEKIVAKGSKIVILGCTYKADVDDIRESPVMELISILSKEYTVHVVDPHVKQYNVNIYEASNDADMVVLGVNHKQFKNISFEVLSKVMRGNKFLDTRNFCDKQLIEKSGLKYFILGGGEDEDTNYIKE
jgi:UDP-N-acetyl-D-mannosaminuronic acid dehydrogenase